MTLRSLNWIRLATLLLFVCTINTQAWIIRKASASLREDAAVMQRQNEALEKAQEAIAAQAQMLAEVTRPCPAAPPSHPIPGDQPRKGWYQ